MTSTKQPPYGEVHDTDSRILRHDLTRFRNKLVECTSRNTRLSTDLVTNLLTGKEKHLRPSLCIIGGYIAATGRNLGENHTLNEATIRAAVAAELLHLGSLYHDDVLDEATTRRGVLTANARWDNVVAVLGGDLLLAISARIAAELGSRECRLTSETLEAMCDGELEELADASNADRSIGSYFQAISGKTAKLFATSCQLGAMQEAADTRLIHVVGEFGYNLGLAFQVIDDVLDLCGSMDIGKPLGQDLKQGIYTLPVLLAMEEVPKIKDLLRTTPTATDVATIRRQICDDSSGISRALSSAESLIERAVAALSDFSASVPEIALIVSQIRALVPLSDVMAR